MSSKTRLGIWLIAGLFLVRQGIMLIGNVIGDGLDQTWKFIVFGAIFIVVGLYLVFMAMVGLRNRNDEEDKK